MPATAHKKLTMPRLGETMEEGTVVAWLAQPGDTLRRGQIIAEIETDKTVVELPALENGVLVSIEAAAGARIPVGGTLATVEVKAAASKSAARKRPRAAKSAAAAKRSGAKRAPRPARRTLASPNARRMARELGVDLADVAPTGRRGRITGADVARSGGNAPAPRKKDWPAPAVDAATGVALYAMPAANPGDRAPVLLIHGLFGDSAAWIGIARSLSAAGTDVYAIDLPGHGASQSRASEVGAIAQAAVDTVRGKIDAPLRVAGISLGSVIACEYALRDPGCESLHLLCPAGLGDTSNAEFIQAMLAASRGAPVREALDHLGSYASQLGPAALEKMVAGLERHAELLELMAAQWFPDGGQKLDILPALGRIDVPVKALFALQDRIFPWQEAANLPLHVAAHFLAESGHMAHLEAQDKVVAFLEDRLG